LRVLDASPSAEAAAPTVFADLESEIEDALRQSPTDDLAIADLKERNLIIADEIRHHRRLVERY